MIPIHNLKQQIDLLDVASRYAEFFGTGNRLRAKLNPIRDRGDFDVYTDTQKWFDHGSGEGGDVVDFIRRVENLSIGEAINFLKENYLGIDAVQDRDSKHKYRTLPKPKTVEQTVEEENYLISNLEQMAAQCLNAFPGKKWSSFTLDIEGFVNDQSIIRVAPIFEKLFEGSMIPTDAKFAKYLFKKIIGYDPYFNCPMIIVRDEGERVVDLVRYRPGREGIPLKQKYLVAKNTIKPHKRGKSFVFPFQQQMMRISAKEGYCFIGEGLKNAVNASIMGIPFVSIESSSSIDNKLIEFLKSPRMNGINLIGAMDGDEAGLKAYTKLCGLIPVSKNMFDFNSGQDFTDYLKSIREEEIYGRKKAS